MKKIVFIMALLLILPLAVLAENWKPYEKTGEGKCVISATKLPGGKVRISVQGFQADKIERYYWGHIDQSPGFEMDTAKGRRFQIITGGKYLFLTPEMVADGGPYILQGCKIDCSNTEGGCCLIVLK
jgi:hypothetical protein